MSCRLRYHYKYNLGCVFGREAKFIDHVMALKRNLVQYYHKPTADQVRYISGLAHTFCPIFSYGSPFTHVYSRLFLIPLFHYTGSFVCVFVFCVRRLNDGLPLCLVRLPTLSLHYHNHYTLSLSLYIIIIHYHSTLYYRLYYHYRALRRKISTEVFWVFRPQLNVSKFWEVFESH